VNEYQNPAKIGTTIYYPFTFKAEQNSLQVAAWKLHEKTEQEMETFIITFLGVSSYSSDPLQLYQYYLQKQQSGVHDFCGLGAPKWPNYLFAVLFISPEYI